MTGAGNNGLLQSVEPAVDANYAFALLETQEDLAIKCVKGQMEWKIN